MESELGRIMLYAGNLSFKQDLALRRRARNDSVVLEAVLLLHDNRFVEVDPGLEIWHRPPLWPLPLLDGELELGGGALGGLGLEVVGQLVEDLEQFAVDADHLVIFLGDAVLEHIVFSHHFSKEVWINGVDDVQHELAVALADGVLGEVQLQYLRFQNHLGKILLARVLVDGHIASLNLMRLEGRLLPLEHLDQEVRGDHALRRQSELACDARYRSTSSFKSFTYLGRQGCRGGGPCCRTTCGSHQASSPS